MTTDVQAELADDDELQMLTVEEVADLFRISPRGVWRQASTRRMPQPVYVGRLARWPQATLKRWIQQGCPRTDDPNRT